jgi:hypothetical protein
MVRAAGTRLLRAEARKMQFVERHRAAGTALHAGKSRATLADVGSGIFRRAFTGHMHTETQTCARLHSRRVHTVRRHY